MANNEGGSFFSRLAGGGERRDSSDHVESEFDAILLQQIAGDLISCMALGGASKRPDWEVHNFLMRAPMILFYTSTVNKLFKSREEILNEHAMRFAHTVGASFALICLIILLFSQIAGWIAVFIFGVLKTISALGFCPASKLYECASDGKCCAFVKND